MVQLIQLVPLRHCGHLGECWHPAQRQPKRRVLEAVPQPHVWRPNCDCAQLAHPRQARSRSMQGHVAERSGLRVRLRPEWRVRVLDVRVLCAHWHSARARAAREAHAHLAVHCKRRIAAGHAWQHLPHACAACVAALLLVRRCAHLHKTWCSKFSASCHAMRCILSDISLCTIENAIAYHAPADTLVMVTVPHSCACTRSGESAHLQ